MTSIREAVKRMFSPPAPIPAGLYHYQAPLEDPRNYRLHLRLEPDGTGLLIVNASTVLHLNQTAAEYAYHLVNQTPESQIAEEFAKRYRVNQTQALQDFRDLRERIDLLIDRQDLDPEIFLGLDSTTTVQHSAPLRLDCALTYRIPPDAKPEYYHAPTSVEEISTTEWKEIIQNSWSFGIPQILFSGGEPTLVDELPELIKFAEENGQVTGLISDGIFLQDPVYFDNLLKSGLDYIVYLLQPEVESSWRILSKLIDADIFIIVHLTITPGNQPKCEEAIDKLGRSGIHAISLSESDPSLTQFLFAIRDRVGKFDIPLVWGLPVPYATTDPIELDPDQPNPSENLDWLYVEPDGTLKQNSTSPTSLGNLLTQTWAEIWSRLE